MVTLAYIFTFSRSGDITFVVVVGHDAITVVKINFVKIGPRIAETYPYYYD